MWSVLQWGAWPEWHPLPAWLSSLWQEPQHLFFRCLETVVRHRVILTVNPVAKTWFCFHWRSRCNIQTALSKHHIQNERHLGSDTTQFGIQVPQWGRFLAFFNLWRMTVKVTGLVQHLLWLCLIYIFTKNGDEQYHRHIHLYCLNKSGMLEHKLAPTYLSTCTWHHTWKVHILTLNSIRTPDLKSQFCCHRTTP